MHIICCYTWHLVQDAEYGRPRLTAFRRLTSRYKKMPFNYFPLKGLGGLKVIFDCTPGILSLISFEVFQMINTIFDPQDEPAILPADNGYPAIFYPISSKTTDNE